MTAALAALSDLVAAIDPVDAVEREHRADVLAWLRTTDDVYRRVAPRTPAKHLAAYALLHDPVADAVLLVDHHLSGLWLPAGGHVDPGEDPGAAAAREAWEELRFDARLTEASTPLFVTVTETSGVPENRHVDVSLWYVFTASVGWTPVVDHEEMASARWWSPDEVAMSDPALFDPHLSRCLAKLRDRASKA